MFLHSIKILMTPQMDKSLKVRQNAIPRTATAGELLAVKKVLKYGEQDVIFVNLV